MKGVWITTWRELTELARSKSSYNVRILSVAIPCLILFSILFLDQRDIDASSGKEVLGELTIVCSIIAWLVGGFSVFDSISKERREGTLGLLLMTPLKPLGIIFGKWLSSSICFQLNILALIPVFSVPFLAGGVGFYEVFIATYSIYITFLVSSSVGIYISSLFKASRKTFLVTASFLFVSPMLFFVFGAILPLKISPFNEMIFFPQATIGYIFNQGFGGGILPNFGISGIVISKFAAISIHAICWSSMSFFIIKLSKDSLIKRWQFEIQPQKKVSKTRLVFDRWIAWASNPVHNLKSISLKESKPIKHKPTGKIMDHANPISVFWKRDIKTPAWQLSIYATFEALFLLMLIVVVYAMTINWPPMSAIAKANFICRPSFVLLPMAFIFELIFKLIAGFEICRKINEDSKSGGMELILTTPVKDSTFIQGMMTSFSHMISRYKWTARFFYICIILQLFISSSVIFFLSPTEFSNVLNALSKELRHFPITLTFVMLTMNFLDWNQLLRYSTGIGISRKTISGCMTSIFTTIILFPVISFILLLYIFNQILPIAFRSQLLGSHELGAHLLSLGEWFYFLAFFLGWGFLKYFSIQRVVKKSNKGIEKFRSFYFKYKV